MAGSKAGNVYLVDTKHLEESVIRRWRDSIADTEKKSRLAKVKVLGLIPGSKSYKCEVLGVPGTVKLSSRCMTTIHAGGSRTQAPMSTNNLSETSSDAATCTSESSDGEDSACPRPVDTVHTDYSQLTAGDWQKVDKFADQCARLHPNIDKHEKGRLRRDVTTNPCDLFFEFFPLELVEGRFAHWEQHAEHSNRRGLRNLERPLFMKFLSLLLKMSLTGLRRRALYFEEESNPAMPQRVFENILYTIRDVGFAPYQVTEIMPDGRPGWCEDPLGPVRRFADELQAHWQDVYKPGFSMVADESMIGWTGATNVHITVLPNKPTDKGVCMKTLCDARTRVMLAMEFVEAAQQQAQKCFAEEGKSAAVCLRLTAPWHNSRPHLLIADAWFGGMPTAVGMLKRGFFSITNVKLQTKNFCKKELWADAGGKPWTRNARAYRQAKLKIAGEEVAFFAAFHMDKQPMTLLGTAGSSEHAPLVMRRRVYMNEFGDMVRWQGELHQPMIHAEYRSSFNAVDVHNKLALGPRSVCSVGASHLLLKIFLALVAIAETNAYLTYMDIKKLTSSEYSHGDFKRDLERGLLERAARVQAGQGEDIGQASRAATRSAATSANTQLRTQMPPGLQGHRLQYEAAMNRKCLMCGNLTKNVCGCGRSFCGVAKGVTCWAWHLSNVMSGEVDDEPMRWQRGKKARLS
jgi:hypothetical protein